MLGLFFYFCIFFFFGINGLGLPLEIEFAEDDSINTFKILGNIPSTKENSFTISFQFYQVQSTNGQTEIVRSFNKQSKLVKSVKTTGFETVWNRSSTVGENELTLDALYNYRYYKNVTDTWDFNFQYGLKFNETLPENNFVEMWLKVTPTKKMCDLGSAKENSKVKQAFWNSEGTLLNGLLYLMSSKPCKSCGVYTDELQIPNGDEVLSQTSWQQIYFDGTAEEQAERQDSILRFRLPEMRREADFHVIRFWITEDKSKEPEEWANCGVEQQERSEFWITVVAVAVAIAVVLAIGVFIVLSQRARKKMANM